MSDPLLIEEAKTACRAFGFEPVDACHLGFQVLKLSATNKQGQTEELVLKFSLQENPWHAFQERTLSLLEKEGFKTLPRFISLPEGETQCFSQGKYWTCQRYFYCAKKYDFFDFACKPAHCFLAGQSLASLHHYGRRLLDREDLKLTGPGCKDVFRAFPDSLARSISKVKSRLEQAESFQENGNQKSDESKKRNWLAKLAELPETQLQKKAEFLCRELLLLEKESSPTVNHGDFHPANLLFDDQSVVCVLDWDYALLGSGTYDLCYGLLLFTLELPQPGKKLTEIYNQARAEAFLEGYARAGISTKSKSRLSIYSDFTQLLVFNWAVNEVLADESPYTVHARFPDLLSILLALTKSNL